MTDKESSYEKLWKIFRRYLDLKTEDLKLTLSEKITVLISTVAVAAVIALIGGLVLLLLTLAVVHWIGEALGMPWAFLIIAGFYSLLILFAVIFRRQLIINPVARFVTRLILT